MVAWTLSHRGTRPRRAVTTVSRRITPALFRLFVDVRWRSIVQALSVDRCTLNAPPPGPGGAPKPNAKYGNGNEIFRSCYCQVRIQRCTVTL